MIIIEYRIPMPFSAEEYRIGQLYTIAKKSKIESADPKNGVKIISNEPYSNGPGGNGQYTNKTYYLANKIPDWMKKILPDSAAKLKEEAWNAYPYSKNKFTNPLLEKLQLEIESHYLDGPPTIENVFNLTKKEITSRSIVIIDLASASLTNNNNNNGKRSSSSTSIKSSIKKSSSSSNYTDSTNKEDSNDVLKFNPLFREQLTQNWLQEHELAYEKNDSLEAKKEKFIESDDAKLRDRSIEKECDNDNDDVDGIIMPPKRNLMTCYKLCKVNFPVWPIQSKVEQFIQQYCRDTMLESHKQTWLWQDEWTGMNIDQIRDMEKETQKELVEMMRAQNQN